MSVDLITPRIGEEPNIIASPVSDAPSRPVRYRFSEIEYMVYDHGWIRFLVDLPNWNPDWYKTSLSEAPNGDMMETCPKIGAEPRDLKTSPQLSLVQYFRWSGRLHCVSTKEPRRMYIASRIPGNGFGDLVAGNLARVVSMLM